MKAHDKFEELTKKKQEEEKQEEEKKEDTELSVLLEIKELLQKEEKENSDK